MTQLLGQLSAVLLPFHFAHSPRLFPTSSTAPFCSSSSHFVVRHLSCHSSHAPALDAFRVWIRNFFGGSFPPAFFRVPLAGCWACSLPCHFLSVWPALPLRQTVGVHMPGRCLVSGVWCPRRLFLGHCGLSTRSQLPARSSIVHLIRPQQPLRTWFLQLYRRPLDVCNFTVLAPPCHATPQCTSQKGKGPHLQELVTWGECCLCLPWLLADFTRLIRVQKPVVTCFPQPCGWFSEKDISIVSGCVARRCQVVRTHASYARCVHSLWSMLDNWTHPGASDCCSLSTPSQLPARSSTVRPMSMRQSASTCLSSIAGSSVGVYSRLCSGYTVLWRQVWILFALACPHCLSDRCNSAVFGCFSPLLLLILSQHLTLARGYYTQVPCHLLRSAIMNLQGRQGAAFGCPSLPSIPWTSQSQLPVKFCADLMLRWLRDAWLCTRLSRLVWVWQSTCSCSCSTPCSTSTSLTPCGPPQASSSALALTQCVAQSQDHGCKGAMFGCPPLPSYLPAGHMLFHQPSRTNTVEMPAGFSLLALRAIEEVCDAFRALAVTWVAILTLSMCALQCWAIPLRGGRLNADPFLRWTRSLCGRWGFILLAFACCSPAQAVTATYDTGKTMRAPALAATTWHFGPAPHPGLTYCRQRPLDPAMAPEELDSGTAVEDQLLETMEEALQRLLQEVDITPACSTAIEPGVLLLCTLLRYGRESLTAAINITPHMTVPAICGELRAVLGDAVRGEITPAVPQPQGPGLVFLEMPFWLMDKAGHTLVCVDGRTVGRNLYPEVVSSLFASALEVLMPYCPHFNLDTLSLFTAGAQTRVGRGDRFPVCDGHLS